MRTFAGMNVLMWVQDRAGLAAFREVLKRPTPDGQFRISQPPTLRALGEEIEKAVAEVSAASLIRCRRTSIAYVSSLLGYETQNGLRRLFTRRLRRPPSVAKTDAGYVETLSRFVATARQ